MELIKKTVRSINFINQLMSIIIGLIIAFLSIVIFYDVVSRYLFDSPTSFGYDTSIWLTGAIAFISGGYVVMKDEHIRVDIFYEKFSERRKSIVNLITHIFIFLTVFVLIWFGGAHVLKLYEQGIIATTGLNIPIWIKWIIVPIGGLLLGLQALVTLIKDIYLLITGQVFEEDK